MQVFHYFIFLTLKHQIFFLLKNTASATRFTFVNSCDFTVWVGTQPNGGIPILSDGGGFKLGSGESSTEIAPKGWGGRFWGRTDCVFGSSGLGSCVTGDCGGKMQCEGAGGVPPASLFEITLDGANGMDFYDVSLVDGYNLPMRVVAIGGTGNCGSPGCTSDLNAACPKEQQVVSAGEVVACKSACAAYNEPQYCCTGEFGSPITCKPTLYSTTFKRACPTAYSYAYDDATSTFTCTGANYILTFCPKGT
ncbi:unnamed protein product [Sphagnum jensenii]|uniref:Thaumatin-like protein n=1 Tax=Sphagnum jensenii TaxID=128206 RepID=A0ABP0VTB6_9BRYO